jgi:hypothetical protein
LVKKNQGNLRAGTLTERGSSSKLHLRALSAKGFREREESWEGILHAEPGLPHSGYMSSF